MLDTKATFVAAKDRAGRKHNRGAEQGNDISLAMLYRMEDMVKRNESRGFMMASLEVSSVVITRYIRIIRQPSKELRGPVNRLELSVTAAAMIAKFPLENQREIASSYLCGDVSSHELRGLNADKLMERIRALQIEPAEH